MSNKNFSEDPIENLQIENEILKLKMQAQFGAIFGGFKEGLTPELENYFLRNVQEVEEAWQDAKSIKIYDLLGRPKFETLEELDLGEIESELMGIKSLMEAKNIFLNILGQYKPSVIYRFITEEFFEHETEVANFPGFQNTFIYEEFHPNHKMDIETTAQGFLRNWFKSRFEYDCLEFDNLMLTSDGKGFTDEEIITKLNETLATYASLSNEKCTILETSWEWDDAQNKGLGCTEGLIQYSALMQGGNLVSVDGPFKFYMSNTNGFWNIFYFIFPGFEW